MVCTLEDPDPEEPGGRRAGHGGARSRSRTRDGHRKQRRPVTDLQENFSMELATIAIIAAFVFGSNYYKGKQTERIGFLAQENAEIFVRDHSQTYGNDDAKVYLIGELGKGIKS